MQVCLSKTFSTLNDVHFAANCGTICTAPFQICSLAIQSRFLWEKMTENRLSLVARRLCGVESKRFRSSRLCFGPLSAIHRISGACFIHPMRPSIHLDATSLFFDVICRHNSPFISLFHSAMPPPSPSSSFILFCQHLRFFRSSTRPFSVALQKYLHLLATFSKPDMPRVNS